MHNTRKLEEMSNSEGKPQRRLLNKKDIVECVCLWLWVSVCVLHPLWFEFHQFCWMDFKRQNRPVSVCALVSSITHLAQFLTVNAIPKTTEYAEK